MNISSWSRYHGAPGGGLAKSTCAGGDFHDSVGEEIFAAILECASGKQSKSEAFGMGEDEFVPWTVGAIL
jgi:altronate dehydratase